MWNSRGLNSLRYCSARTPLSHTAERYLRQFAPQVVSGRVAVHVTQQIILKKTKQNRKLISLQLQHDVISCHTVCLRHFYVSDPEPGTTLTPI